MLSIGPVPDPQPTEANIAPPTLIAHYDPRQPRKT